LDFLSAIACGDGGWTLDWLIARLPRYQPPPPPPPPPPPEPPPPPNPEDEPGAWEEEEIAEEKEEARLELNSPVFIPSQ
jgi:hypothetical protein